jgi:diguanylate cyclase (GGDEF)-like protein
VDHSNGSAALASDGAASAHGVGSLIDRWRRLVVVVAAIFCAVGLLGYGAVVRLVGAFEQSAQETRREIAFVSDLRVALSEEENAGHDLIDNGSASAERFLTADRVATSLFARGEELLDTDTELELLARAEREWSDLFGELRVAAADGERADELAAAQDDDLYHFELATAADRTIAWADDVAAASASRVDDRLAAARRSSRRLTVAFVVLFCAFAVIAVRFFRHTQRDVLGPLRDLHDTAVRYGGGDFAARPGVYRAEELADVARAFDAMATSVDEHRTRLTAQAYSDGLTGLPNRRSLIERLERLVASGAPGGVMYIDLDDFKLVNDGLGHAAGDDLLRQVAARLADATRRTDLVARLGGDEFAVLLGPPTTQAEARAVAARTVEALEQPFEVAGRSVRIGASVGVSLCRPQIEDASLLLSEADVAMYAAKSGAGSVELFEPARHADDEARDDARLRALTERRQPIGG